MHKLAFCFFIYDKINHEELWKTFFENVNKDKYEIYIHYKDNTPLKYFEQYKLTNCIPTEYAKISFVHANNLVFKRAFEDNCYKFITLSQACIPLKSFDYVYEFLTKDNYCHFNIALKFTVFPSNISLLESYRYEDIQKSSNWFILNRNICELVLQKNKTEIDNEYANIISPEEIFYITLIYHHKCTDQIITTPNLADGATTFTNWHDMDYKYHDSLCNKLKNYSYISEEELKHLTNSNSIFGRKFNVNCIGLYENQEYMQTIFSK